MKRVSNAASRQTLAGSVNESIPRHERASSPFPFVLLIVTESLEACQWPALFGKDSAREKHELWNRADLDSRSSFATYLRKLPNLYISVPTLEKYNPLFTRTFFWNVWIQFEIECQFLKGSNTCLYQIIKSFKVRTPEPYELELISCLSQSDGRQISWPLWGLLFSSKKKKRKWVQ